MSYEQKDNTGALFRNDKQGNDKRPDYTGKALVDGTEKRLSAWLKEDRNGNKYLSLSIQDPQPSGGQRPVPDDPLESDSVPF